MSNDYADGGVHTLTMGQSELSTILAAAAQRSQLVLVDFSASWCGPCRMMVPVLHRLAGEHRGRLAVVKVDCEQTAANQDLARSSAISAFPTFHLYRNQAKVHEMRGADQAGLRRAIEQQLAQLSPAGRSGGTGTGGGAMAAALAAALARVKAGCSFDEFVTAARTLLTFVGNLLDHPGEEKYRRIKLSNAAFQSKLGSRAGGKECMTAIGFREMVEAGEAVLVMSQVPAELPRVRELLQQALQQAEAAARGAAAAERRYVTAAPPPQAATPPSAGAPSSMQPPVAASASSNVDAAALARALAAAMRGDSGTGAIPGGATAGPGSATAPAAQPAPGMRALHITPEKLARVLAKAMQDCGITGALPAALPPQQEQQPEGAP